MKTLAIVVALVSVAHADNKSKTITAALSDALSMSADDKLPAIVILDTETKFKEAFIYGDGSPTSDLLHTVVGVAADGSSGWIAADTGAIIACGMEGCDKILRDAERAAKTTPPYHHTALVEDGKVLFLHVGSTGKGVGHGAAMDADIPADAKPVVEQFQKTIADPKAFAATISKRKDVLLYGTEPTERFVGGAAAKATLLKWNLGLSAVGGIRAGVTKSKTVAWIAADVEAKSLKSKSGTTTEYRLTVVYEKTGSEWKVVQIHFS
jgi:hypothetical protein